MTADRSGRINCELYRVLLSAQIQTHAAKLIRLQMVNDQKSILLRVSQAKEIGYSSMDKSVS